ncbi:MAG: site-2 protease family protein [Candidatus Doudnabacteria bacterium]|nr:site-2 protease family protein [Candidatus Doudnabacteria bacterium]
MDATTLKIIDVIILIFSVVVHEVSHGLMAEKFGDDTAREAGRITLNPIPHIDPIGSILMPFLVGIGAARPVPVNFDNLRPQRLGMAMVALAGPLSNFALAILFLFIIRLGLASDFAAVVLGRGIFLNIALGVFNLIPIPPLDGSKVLLSVAPRSWQENILKWESYGFIVLIILVMTGLLSVLVEPLYRVVLSVIVG